MLISVVHCFVLECTEWSPYLTLWRKSQSSQGNFKFCPLGLCRKFGNCSLLEKSQNSLVLINYEALRMISHCHWLKWCSPEEQRMQDRGQNFVDRGGSCFLGLTFSLILTLGRCLTFTFSAKNVRFPFLSLQTNFFHFLNLWLDVCTLFYIN